MVRLMMMLVLLLSGCPDTQSEEFPETCCPGDGDEEVYAARGRKRCGERGRCR